MMLSCQQKLFFLLLQTKPLLHETVVQLLCAFLTYKVKLMHDVRFLNTLLSSFSFYHEESTQQTQAIDSQGNLPSILHDIHLLSATNPLRAAILNIWNCTLSAYVFSLCLDIKWNVWHELLWFWIWADGYARGRSEICLDLFFCLSFWTVWQSLFLWTRPCDCSGSTRVRDV